MRIGIKDSDVKFADQAQVGRPDYTCSRCGELILPEDCPMVIYFGDGGQGEYRYHLRCLLVEPAAKPPDP